MRQPGDESFIRIIDFGRPSDVNLYKLEEIYLYVCMCTFMCNNRRKIDVDREGKIAAKNK